MQEFYVTDPHGEPIGRISLSDDVAARIGREHPRMELGFSFNRHEPEKILAFCLVFPPHLVR